MHRVQDSVTNALTLGCVRWRGTDNSQEVDLRAVMLVTVYGGSGCRPRYRCVRVLRQSSSLLYLQLSDASSWPLVRSPRDPVDCRAFQFDRWTTSPPATVSTATSSASSTMSGYLLSLVAADREASSVDCRLPSDVAGVQYEVEFVVDDDVDKCSGSLTTTQSAGRGALTLSVSGCGTEVRRRFADSVSQCLESSSGSADDGELLIITSSDSSGNFSSQSLSCWLFTRRRKRHRARARLSSSSSLSFYLLTGEQCHTAVAARSTSSFRPTRRLTYTAFFSRPRPLPPFATTSTPRTTTSPQSPAPSLSEPTATPPGNDAWTPPPRTAHRPRPRNVTMHADSTDQDEQPVNAFVVGFVAVLMALIQLILLLCHC